MRDRRGDCCCGWGGVSGERGLECHLESPAGIEQHVVDLGLRVVRKGYVNIRNRRIHQRHGACADAGRGRSEGSKHGYGNTQRGATSSASTMFASLFTGYSLAKTRQVSIEAP